MVWSHPHSSLFFILLVLGLVGSLALAFRIASTPYARSKVLLALRAAALGTLVLILLNPTRVQETRQAGEQPAAIFLLDESRSMSLEAPRSRAESGHDLIERALLQVPRGHRPTIRRFGFGTELTALSDNDDAIRPKDDETRLNWALEQLASRFGDGLPFGVFVFSDGRSTDAEPLDSTAKAYRELGVPVHVVALGDDERVSGDVAISDIDAPREVRAGTRVPVRVSVRSRGFAGQRAELCIRSTSEPSAGPIATLPVTLSDGEQTPEIVIETDRAKGLLTAEISSFPHEAVASNNSVGFQIFARDSRIRVIYMEGSAAPEYRFLQDALHEDPSIKCTSMLVGNQADARPRLSRVDEPARGFPTTREELFGYDVVICSDIAQTAFTQEQLDWTVKLVAKRGGGFAMIGGVTSFGSGGWDQSLWDGLIPVDMSGRGAGRSEFYSGGFRVLIPAQAMDHPIWRIVDDPGRNRQVLAAMPMFYGTNLTDRLKPAATPLGLSQGPLSGYGVMTVFSCQPFGRGRTFAMSTDTTMAWGSDFEHNWGERDNRYFRKFWRNVVRWLAENSEASQQRLRIETDKIIYHPGGQIQITARAYDDQIRETNRYRLIARLRKPDDPESRPFDETAHSLAPDPKDVAYRGTLAAPQPAEILANAGSTLHKFSLDVAALDGDRVVARSSVELETIDDPAEFHDPRPDHAKLFELAKGSGGRAIRSPAELTDLLAGHPDATVRVVVNRWPLWDHPLLWLILLGFLTSEWILRRRKGLA
jgi:uncharacterized membrane protein